MTTKKKKSKGVASVMPIYPRIVVHRIKKGEKSDGGIIVARLDLEETPFATVFEPGENADFEVGDLILINPSCGHDFRWNPDDETDLDLTFLNPDDVISRVEGTPQEKMDLITRAKKAM